MANIDAKRTIRTFKDFSLGLSANGGGGSVVVTELPEVGEEHTVYELHQEISADFSWLLTEIDKEGAYPRMDTPIIVVENEDQVTREYLQMPWDDNVDVYVYVRSTNNLYLCWIEIGEQENTFEKDIMHPDESKIYDGCLVILRDFDYHANIIVEPTVFDGTGHFLDGTEFNYADYDINIVPLVLTEAKNPIRLGKTLEGYRNCKNVNNTTELPTAKQAVDGNMCDTDGYVWYPEFINIQNKVLCYNKTSTDTYSWNFDNQKFGVVVEGDEFVEYIGELEWLTDSIQVVNKIDLNISKDEGYPVFNPQPAHTEITYWIYTDGEWVNIDEIPDPNLIKVGITCTNGNYDVTTLPLNTITVTYDDVDYNVTQYAETRSGDEITVTTYYGYIEVPMPTQDNLTHTIKVSTTESPTDWLYSTSIGDSYLLDDENPSEGQGILAIAIYYEHNA